ncbi:MAG: Gfo/Idh/MocA family oxidoreductase [Anaerolineales bacterium]
MKKPVQIGIIGCGSVVRRPYMTLINRLRNRGQAEVAIACDLDPARGEILEKEWGITCFTTNYREVVQSEKVDLVLVTTSMPSHGAMTRAALEAGKHVLVEKPMATTLEEAASLVALAKESPGHLVCAPHVLLSPTYQKMWKRVQDGDIGQVHLARARYGWAGPWWGRWFYQSGGGPLFDLGVYNVTSLTGFLGPAQRVTAMTGIGIPQRVVEGETIQVETEDNFQILIDFGNTCFASVTTGFTIQKYRGPAIELYGTQGTIQMLGNDWAPNGYELWLNEVGAWQLYGETDAHWPWTDGLNHLVNCIQQGTHPLTTPEHAYHVLEIMIKAAEAGRDGRTKTIESRFDPPKIEVIEEQLAAHLMHDRRHH